MASQNGTTAGWWRMAWMAACFPAFCHPGIPTARAQDGKSQPRTVKAVVQTRPGGPMHEAEMAVHEAPVDLPMVGASEASLDDDDLVLGVVVDGQPVAYPVRYLAMFEVVNSRAGKKPLAPTW